jgi:hypothetical protein
MNIELAKGEQARVRRRIERPTSNVEVEWLKKTRIITKFHRASGTCFYVKGSLN